MVDALREEEYEVIHVADGEKALAWHGRRITDVLITDVKLPGGIDGWQIAEHCRATLSDSAMNLAKLYGRPPRPRYLSGA